MEELHFTVQKYSSNNPVSCELMRNTAFIICFEWLTISVLPIVFNCSKTLILQEKNHNNLQIIVTILTQSYMYLKIILMVSKQRLKIACRGKMEMLKGK